ncbi:retrotransposon protein, putative, ty1-copia subclass [Tanacetum coccineum]
MKTIDIAKIAPMSRVPVNHETLVLEILYFSRDNTRRSTAATAAMLKATTEVDLWALPSHGEFFQWSGTTLFNFRTFYFGGPLKSELPALEGQQVAPEIIAAHNAWIKGSKEIVGLMLMTMEPEIQRNLENLHANDMLKELKTLFAQQAEQELLQTTRDFHSCKQEEGQCESSYVLKMKSYIDNLERLGQPVTLNLAVSLILIGLRKEFDGFMQNYNMHSLGKTVNELHAMLKLHEQTLPKNNAPALHAIRAGKVQKGNNKHKKQQPQLAARGPNQGKGKNKLAYAPKPKIPPPPKREDPAKDSICHECGETGHWKRNCPQYLAELLKKKKNAASGGLRASRKLKPGALSLYVGNGQREAVEAIGVFYLCLPSGLEIVLNNCHYAPSITRGVIYVSRLYEDGFINRFVNNTIQVSRNNMVYFSAILKDDIFEIDLSNSYANESSIYTISNKRAKLDLDSALLWHCRLKHISKKRVEKLQHDGLLNSTDLRAFEKCVPCMSGKMTRKHYTHQVDNGPKTYLTITQRCYVYLLKHKHEVFETFKVFQKEVEKSIGKILKSLRSDRRGEYMSQEFLDHLKEHGIIAHRTPPYTPQHNGVSERRNRTLLDMVRSMMSQTTLPKSFWDYALETAARILNMVPTKKVEKTPYEVWHGQAPKLSYLKVWGCEALVKRDTLTKPDKLEPRSIKCIFVGYPKETMGYSFYYPPENKVLVARNAEFLENSLITQKVSGSLEDLEIIQEEDTHPSIDTILNHEEGDLEIYELRSDIIPIRRSIRTRHAPDRMCLYIDAEEHELGDLGEPANYKAALLDPESDKWLNAMNVEMQSMKDNEVWDLVDLPPNGKTIGSKWLFKKKTDMDRAVHTYKARLVTKGYTQTSGIDYKETFSSVADIRAIRILLAITAFYDYEIWKIDVKTAFLNGYLSKEVYMEQPEASESNVTFLILYVGDILIMGNNIPMLQDVKSYIGRCFAMKDLGEAAYILEIKIYRDRSRRLIRLCQSAYIKKILKRFYMENSKRGSSIMYAVRCTRPDVAFAQNITSRFQQNLGDLHRTTVKNILKYLKNTKDMFLVYGGDIKQEFKVSCYTDVGYLTDADDLKSQTGYVFVLNGGAVDWKSAKQSIFATSSVKAEYIATYDASKEVVWVKKFISGLGVVPTIEEPINMYCDNTGAITMANESGITKGARHFRAKVHYLRKVIEFGDVKLEKVHTDDNLADPFTKALAFTKHSEHTKNIGMLPASSLM